MHSYDKATLRSGKEQLADELRATEHKESDIKLHESLNTLIRHSMGDSYASLASWSGEKPVQCIYWPDAFDQHLASKLTRGMKVEVGLEMRDREAEGNSPASLRDSSANDTYHTAGKAFQTSGLQSLKVPQAVVAFTQAAVKINGWPLLSPAKVQLQKCEKCSEEFYSSLNFRRHIRIHRHLLHANKEDLRKEKDRIAAFWNKLTPEAASQILSVENMTKEDPSGVATVKALTALIRQPRLAILPQTFLNCGNALLGVMQNKGSVPHIRADEFFCILDDASESTFLCGGTSASVQRFVYHGEAEKLGLEDRNLVASLAFLIEQKLVKAWMIDKDLEALRCQKELVEEEEAAQKRRERLLEKKRQKKIRQKEKEKQEVLNDQQGDLIDDSNILRSEEEGDSPLANSPISVSPASLKEDLDETQASDLQMTESFSCFEENVLLKSIHTLEQLVRSDSSEGLQAGASIGHVSPSEEENSVGLASRRSDMNQDIEGFSTLETVSPLHRPVHKAISTGSFESKTGSSQARDNNLWTDTNPRGYQKFLTRNFTDGRLMELEYANGIKYISKKSLPSTNGLKKDELVSMTAIKNDVQKPEQYRTRVTRQSKTSVDVLGTAVWAKKNQLTFTVDHSKNMEIMVDTPTFNAECHNLDKTSLQEVSDRTTKHSGTVCSSLDSKESDIHVPASFEQPNHEGKVHDTRVKAGSISKCTSQSSEPTFQVDGASFSIDSIDSFVGAVNATLEERGVSDTVKLDPSHKTSVVNTFGSPMETYAGGLLIGSLKVPLHTFVADKLVQECPISIDGADDSRGSCLGIEAFADEKVTEAEPIDMVSRSGLKSRSVNGEKSQIQCLSLVKNEQPSNQGDSTHSVCILASARWQAVGTSDCHEQATTCHFSKNFRTGFVESTVECAPNDPGQTVQGSENQSTTNYRNALPMARDTEADAGKEWRTRKDGKFHSTSLDQFWVSISDIAVAAFLSQRWNSALQAMEAASASI